MIILLSALKSKYEQQILTAINDLSNISKNTLSNDSSLLLKADHCIKEIQIAKESLKVIEDLQILENIYPDT
jgi:hypothetical protein